MPNWAFACSKSPTSDPMLDHLAPRQKALLNRLPGFLADVLLVVFTFTIIKGTYEQAKPSETPPKPPVTDEQRHHPARQCRLRQRD